MRYELQITRSLWGTNLIELAGRLVNMINNLTIEYLKPLLEL